MPCYTRNNSFHTKKHTKTIRSKNSIRTIEPMRQYISYNNYLRTPYYKPSPYYNSSSYIIRHLRDGTYVSPFLIYLDILNVELETFNTLPINPEINNIQRELTKESKQKLASLENINDLLCTISQELMSMPVETKCGHTFDKIFLEEWIQRNNTCPICRENIDMSSLKVNTTILRKIKNLNLTYNK